MKATGYISSGRRCLALILGVSVLSGLLSANALARVPVLSANYYNQGTSNEVLLTFFAGTDSNIYYMTYPYNAGMWGQVTGINKRPPLGAQSTVSGGYNIPYGQPELFYLTTTATGATHIEQSFSGLQDTYDLSVLSNTPTANLPAPNSSLGPLSDYCQNNDSVYYVGKDQHIHVLTWSPGKPWKHQDLTAMASGAKVQGTVTDVRESQYSVEIFYVGTNGHIDALWSWIGCGGGPAANGWHYSDISAQAKGVPLPLSGTPLTGFWDYQGQLDTVYFIDQNHNVQQLQHTLFYPQNGPWSSVNLTKASGAPVAGAGSPLNFSIQLLAGSGFVEVSFFDQGMNIWQIFSNPTYNSPWALGEPSAGYPAAVAGSPLMTFINNDSCPPVQLSCEAGDYALEYYYITPDQHVHKLSNVINNSSTYSSQDITAATGAPVSAP